MANESTNSSAALSLGVDTKEAVESTRLLRLELEKLKDVAASVSNTPVGNNATVQSLRTARAEAEALSRDFGSTASTAGRSAGEKFTAGFSQTLGDGVRISYRKAGTDLIGISKEVSAAQIQAQQLIRNEYGRTALEQSRMEKADLDSWKLRTSAANVAAAELQAIAAKSQAQLEAIDTAAHTERVALERKTTAQLQAIDEANHAQRIANIQAERVARAAANADLMGRGGIGNRLLTGTSSSDLSSLALQGGMYAQQMELDSANAKMLAQQAKLEAAQNKTNGAQRTGNTLNREAAMVMNDAHAAARGLSGSLGQLWVTYGNIAPLVAFAAMGAAMRSTYTVGKELEYELKFVKVVADDAAVSTERFFGAVGQSMSLADDAARGLRMLAQSGLSTADAMDVLPGVLNLATIGEVSVKEAAEAATGAMQAFGLQITDFERIGDVFAKASAMSNASVQSLMESMRQASTVSDFYDISLEQTAASLATMAKANIVGSAAGTALRNAMKELYTPTEKAKNALEDVGIKVFDNNGKMGDYTSTLEKLRMTTSKMSEESKLTFLNDVFGERGAKAINQILSNYGTYTNVLKELNEANGFVNKGVAELQDTVEGASIRMKNALNESFFKAFEDSDGSIRKTIDSLAEGFAKPEFQEALATLAQLAAAFTTVLVENAGTIVTLLEIYLGARGLAMVAQGFTMAAKVADIFTASTVAGAVAAEVSTAANLANTAAVTANAAASAGAAVTTATWANRIGLVSRALGPIGFAIAGVAGAYQIYHLMQTNAAEGADEFTRQSRSILSALDKENAALADSIRLLKEKAGLQPAQSQVTVGNNVAEAFEREAKARQKLADIEASQKNVRSTSVSVAARDSAEKELAGATKYRTDLVDKINLQVNQRGQQVDLQQRTTMDKELDYLIETASNGTEKAKKYVEVAKALKATVYNGKSNTADIASQMKVLKGLINSGQDNSYKGQTKDDNSVKGEIRRQADADLDAIKKKWDFTNEEEQRGFNNYKQLLDQRVGDGAISAAAAGVMIDAKAAQLRATLDGNTSLESAELDAYQKGNQQLQDSSITRLNTLRDSISREQKVRKDSAEQTATLRNQAVIDEELAASKALEKTKAKLQEQASLNNARSTRDFDRRHVTDPVDIAGQAAYEQTFAANASAVQQYADKLEAAKIVLADLQNAQGVSAEALAQETRAVTLAEERYQAMLQVQAKLSEQSRDLAESQEIVAGSFEDGSKRSFAAFIRNAGTTADQTERLFTKAFSSASEELLNFTKTGELNFKSFASSIIDEIIRIEIQRSMSQVLGGDGVGGFLQTIVKGFMTGGSTGGSTAVPQMGASMFTAAAKGASFDGGTYDFAKGGAFTNNVYTSETPFMFAKGGGFAPGRMAEAGPEAVMPLKRDSQGRLGVSLNGGGVGGASNTIHNTVHVTVQGGKDADETGDIVSNKVLQMMQGVADQQIAKATRLNGMLNKVTG